MRLTELLRDDETAATGDVDILGLTEDSRRVVPGSLFAALPGHRADGRAFIAEAIARGAVAVLAPAGTQLPAEAAGVPVIVSDNPRRRLAQLAARFFVPQPSRIAAVTGTNGKTSVVWFLRQIWNSLGIAGASIGTLGVHAPGLEQAGSLTTPDPVALHEALARLALRGVDHVAMEASSHGLDQCRLDGVRVSAAAFTNLTRDHLDYHGTRQAYLEAKLRLFTDLLVEHGTAVVNADADDAPAVLAAVRGRGIKAITVGRAGAGLRLLEILPKEDGQRLSLDVFGKPAVVQLPLAGDFQASNALTAAGLAIALGVQPPAALDVLGRLAPVPGRLERVARVGDASVYVDYAHTPDALASALAALRPVCRGRLFLVFGCGGNRDAGKRPEMGAVAAQLADRIVVTDDNPRNEAAATIRMQILVACPGATEIGDRKAAIAETLEQLAAGDILLIAGKGHETGQIIGNRVLPFDDRAVVRELARGRAA